MEEKRKNFIPMTSREVPGRKKAPDPTHSNKRRNPKRPTLRPCEKTKEKAFDE